MTNIQEENKKISFNTNISYSKARNFAKRQVMNVRMMMRQFHPHSKNRRNLFRDEWKTILLLIQTKLNSTPYHSMSLIRPESILNSRSQIADYNLPLDDESNSKQEQMKNLANALQKVRLIHLVEINLL